MSVMQMVVVKSADGESHVSLDPIATNVAAAAPRAEAPIYGSFDLLRIATAAKNQKYILDGFTVTDSSLRALTGAQQEEAQEALLGYWKESGADGVLKALNEGFRGRAIAGIKLIDAEMHSVNLLRHGVIDTAEKATAEKLADIAVIAAS